MKQLILLLFSCLIFSSYAQTEIYSNYTELTGMEDYNGNTNLFYRINSSHTDEYVELYYNNIYNYNITAGTDSLFLRDDDCYYSGMGGYLTHLLSSYDIWGKDLKKVVQAAAGRGYDLNFALRAYYFNYDEFINTGIAPIVFVSADHYKDSVFTFVFDDFIHNKTYFIKCLGISQDSLGNRIKLFDTLGDFRATSHSPFEENVYFGIQNKMLMKTTDEGQSGYLVDPAIDNTWQVVNTTATKTLYYDPDQLHIYRIILDYGSSELRVSGNKGEPSTWQVKFSSPNRIYISNDDAESGLIYLATGKDIYVSSDYGDNFSVFKTMDKRITGIYKKPHGDTLYVSTPHKIYRITNDNISIIKTLFDNDQLKFDPLQVGNRWVYNEYLVSNGTVVSKNIKVKEVLKDTAINNKTYKKIKSGTTIQFQRIDNTSGLVYLIDNSGNEYIADDLNIMVGDTNNYSRYFFLNQTTVLISNDIFNQFNTNNIKRNYITTGAGFGYTYYSLTKGFGLTFLKEEIEDNATVDSIKGCRINGIVYGDTNTVVGINDEASDAIPNEYRLSQNYPNPFNPSTTIEYAIPRSGKVTLKIYDLLGREIYQLVNEEKDAGTYKVEFNAAWLSSGVYFYKLESGSFTQIKKLMLIK